MIIFDRALCSNLSVSEQREWLVTNGIGGYAAGTISGILTRRYHGLLIAALKPPLARTLLVSKLDETIEYDGKNYSLFANRWAEDVVEAYGLENLEQFHLEGTTPVWTYACADAILEKRIWMTYGSNTTYVRYDLKRGTLPFKLSIKALVNFRDHHEATAADASLIIKTTPRPNGMRVKLGDDGLVLNLLSQEAAATPQYDWINNFYLATEAFRGIQAYDSNIYAGLFETTLDVGQSVTLVASLEDNPILDGELSYQERRAYEENLIKESGYQSETTEIQQLVLAADQFIVKRSTTNDPDGQTIIAGYPWFGDWGRDTMISLSGLTLGVGRPDIARRILETFKAFVDQGMLPNRFPEIGEAPEYNTVDATLWYFEAIRSYYAATNDVAFLQEIFPILEDIIQWHIKGTRYDIHVDPQDGLLHAGVQGSQLTWMDVKIKDWVVTPRVGKPIEVNSLWVNALHFMVKAASILGKSAEEYTKYLQKGEIGFQRFWNPSTGYCFDVLDAPEGDDPSLRPNQVIAISLPHCPLSKDQQRHVLDISARKLLTSHGLRSLSPDASQYIGTYGGDQAKRDAAYHQGTVWAWLIGPFVSAYLRIYGNPKQAKSFLQPLLNQLQSHCVGNISEIFEGNTPFSPRGCFAQAWSVGELLRVWQEIINFEQA